MSAQEQVEKLALELKETLDLDELESKIYLSLLRTGPITASALAKDLNIDRARMYRTVDKLVDRNIISTTLSSPKLCIAVEPEKALKIALEKKEEEIKKIKKSGEAIVDKINNEITTNQGTNIPTLRIVQGRSNIYTDIAQMIENCTDTVYLATTLEDISKMYHSIIPEKIKICEKNGGKVLLLVEVDDMEMISFVKRFNATETRVCKLPSQGRIAVQKDQQMIMSDSSQASSNSDTDFSLSTNAKDMINNIENLCRLLWKSSKPIETATKKTKKSKSN
ncbi:MAG: TrmB family transcriptional regulator [Nitrosopumilus sp.]|jgi:sugar-specific transcriptional regulator TrmB|uniref:TrmB family transcriptional regulator n=1 Tax=Candidatus Nitrosomaritimum aestuariumsis TaxID=3342354 RepID=A0AC60WAJ4_9ARCH|nr:TrmB family transcriptional regulator [Nitrosopumilaceae archaeon]MBA4464069.1 TrmB family transcriptional regulator [Nitrosopumilaceae archaeon]